MRKHQPSSVAFMNRQQKSMYSKALLCFQSEITDALRRSCSQLFVFCASIFLNFFSCNFIYIQYSFAFHWNYNAKQIWRIWIGCRMQRKLYIFEKYTFLHERLVKSISIRVKSTISSSLLKCMEFVCTAYEYITKKKNKRSTGTEMKSYWIGFELGRLIHQNRLYWRFGD